MCRRDVLGLLFPFSPQQRTLIPVLQWEGFLGSWGFIDSQAKRHSVIKFANRHCRRFIILIIQPHLDTCTLNQGNGWRLVTMSSPGQGVAAGQGPSLLQALLPLSLDLVSATCAVVSCTHGCLIEFLYQSPEPYTCTSTPRSRNSKCWLVKRDIEQQWARVGMRCNHDPQSSRGNVQQSLYARAVGREGAR